MFEEELEAPNHLKAGSLCGDETLRFDIKDLLLYESSWIHRFVVRPECQRVFRAGDGGDGPDRAGVDGWSGSLAGTRKDARQLPGVAAARRLPLPDLAPRDDLFDGRDARRRRQRMRPPGLTAAAHHCHIR